MVIMIVPCYNEARRLDIKSFELIASSDIRFIFANDGSTDKTSKLLLESFSSNPYIDILNLSKNRGKAEAVRASALKALSEFPTADWIGFWDADLSTPLSEVPKFLTYQKTFAPNAESIWGSRVYRLGADIRRSALRHYLGRLFATIIAHALKIEAYDTQCGAKLFRPEVARKAFSEPFISSWIFDVEILLRIGQDNVVEYPLEAWHDVPGSKVKILKEAFRVLWDVFVIRRKYIK